MPDATTEIPAADPLRAMVEDWSQSESRRVEDLHRLLEPLEQAVGQLNEWADRVDAAEQSEAELLRQVEARDQAAEERRRRLEHDLKLARARVAELERTLQERTEELLRLQTTNNELAAQLLEADCGEPLENADDEAFIDENPAEEMDGDLMAIACDDDGAVTPSTGESETGEGITERFARLRRN